MEDYNDEMQIYCPISKKIMADPVTYKGRNYDRLSLQLYTINNRNDYSKLKELSLRDVDTLPPAPKSI